MIVQRKGTLPSPYAHISVSVDRCPYWFHVFYTAKPMDLVGAGLVDVFMQERIISRRAGYKSDSKGLRFSVRAFRQAAFAAWERGETLTLQRFPRGDEEALTLPGVRDLFPDGFQPPDRSDEDIRKNPSPGDLVSGTFERASSQASGRVITRQRQVGRFRRLVHWDIVDGVLIAPNWAELARQRALP